MTDSNDCLQHLDTVMIMVTLSLDRKGTNPSPFRMSYRAPMKSYEQNFTSYLTSIGGLTYRKYGGVMLRMKGIQ